MRAISAEIHPAASFYRDRDSKLTWMRDAGAAIQGMIFIFQKKHEEREMRLKPANREARRVGRLAGGG